MSFWLIVITCLFLGVIIIFCAFFICSTIFTAPWVPSSKKDVFNILEAATIKEGDVIYDLGSGDGRIIINAAKKYPIKKAIGIEISPFFYLISWLQILLAGLGSKVKVKLANFYKVNLSDANVVICYLFPKEMKKLADKFQKELKPDTRVVSLAFPIVNWQPEKIIRPSSGFKSIFIYKI